jgi:hypothetical protein
MVLTYTAGDSEPSFEVTVYDRDGSALDLSAANHVEFRAKLTTGATTITRTGAITTPTAGLCTFTWTTTDLATIGIYNLQVRVYWTSTRWSSHPNDTYDALVIIREVEA